MVILFTVLWQSLNRISQQHQRIMGTIPKLLTHLRADLREVEKNGKLVLPTDRVRIIPKSGGDDDEDMENIVDEEDRGLIDKVENSERGGTTESYNEVNTFNTPRSSEMN